MSHEPPPTWAQQRESVHSELAAIAAEGRHRKRPLIDAPQGRRIALVAGKGEGGRRERLINWASNDYLGLAKALTVRNAAARALRRYGSGAGAARLLSGGLRCHRDLELRLAAWLGTADALVTTTGYQANLATLVALASDPEDVVILDRLCHASLYDGARLAAGTLVRFRHNDLDDLATALRRTEGARRRTVCVESVYSMDGDTAPLAGIAALCRERGALLLVDEAHALGVLGPEGRGCCAAAGIVPDVLIGTCSKALAAQGGLIAADADLIDLIVNRGRAFIYSTAPVPAAMGAAAAALALLREEPDHAKRVLAHAARLRRELAALGYSVPAGDAAIVPLLVGDEHAALALAAGLRGLGHYAPAIRPPTVPAGSCRIRISLTAAHTDADVRKLIAACAQLRGTAAP